MSVIAFTALALLLPANAQNPPGSTPEARQVLREFGRCMVASKRNLVKRAIVEDWSTRMLLVHDLISSDCMDREGSLSIMPAAIKASFSEWLLATEKNELAPVEVAKAPEISLRDLDVDDGVKAEERYQQYVILARLGECAIRTDPIDARALLRTDIGSAAEDAAARRLVPAMSKCLAAGNTLTLNSETVRGAVALSYYRMELAAQGMLWRPNKRGGDR